ncbi:hypothetical protein L6164_012275 [Bauhinia variegata]|uniref:Uncharacterized protein n=1 Tax=Bauhinia variegata TaxID=167791 RepID=A0ACB9P9L2_BAUVA|nr:hypothetical protein L6164_012275 [Bauhinia variegata]
MGRDDLYIAVPSFFRCPISLDVMKSPVSLCTGVTYDRSSIQRWLDNGHNTCPSTMQVLQTKEFVPNRTLQRLIQIWTDSVRQRVESTESPPSKSVPSQQQVLYAIRDLQNQTQSQNQNQNQNQNRLDSLSKFLCFAKESKENRQILGNMDGLVPMLIGFLDIGDDAVSGSVEFLEKVVEVLDLVLNDKSQEQREKLAKLILKRQSNCLSSLVLVLRQGSSSESRIGSAKLLEMTAVDAEAKVLIAEKEAVIPELLKLITLTPEKDGGVIENGLSCLVAISMPKRNKMKLVEFGVVRTLSKLISETNRSVGVIEKVLKLLETVSSSKEGRAEICEDERCVAGIMNKVLKVSSVATEHAVTILWSVCYLFRDQKAQEAVSKANGLTKILLLMQSNCSAAVRQMSADLLKIFRVNSKSCLLSYDTNTTHIMPF